MNVRLKLRGALCTLYVIIIIIIHTCPVVDAAHMTAVNAQGKLLNKS